MERSPAGSQQAQRRDRRQQGGDQRRRIQYLLEIVEHQPCGAIVVARRMRADGQIEHRHVRQAKRLGDRRGDELRAPNGGQRHEHHAGRPLCSDRARELQRQARLSGAPRAGEGDEACRGIREPLLQHLHVSIAAEKGRERQREREIAQFLDGRIVSRCPRARKERVTDGTGQVESW
jgi:hypothetical protein